VRSLDETNALLAMRFPEQYRQLPGKVAHFAETLPLVLPPYAIARVDCELT